MDECFDWFSSNTELIEEVLDEVIDLKFLELVEEIEVEGQNRDSIMKILLRRNKYIKLEVFGFDLNLLDRLLNHVPFYCKGLVKEPISKEMRVYIFERDNYKCCLCYSSWSGLYCHHICPQGSANEDNLITLCLRCHDNIHRLLKNKKYPYYVPVKKW